MNRKNEIHAECSIHNRFDIEVIDAKTGAVKKKAQAFNVVCDALWSRFLENPNTAYANYILFGSGSGTPSSVDTVMFTYVGAKQITRPIDGPVAQFDRINGVAQHTYSAVVSENEFVGSSLSEIGIGYDSTHCVTHAMLVDMNGNPIVIEKTNADILNIYATVFLHYNPHGYANGKIRVFDYQSGLADNLLGLAGSNLSRAPTECITGTSPIANESPVTGPYIAVTRTTNVQEKTMTFTTERFAAGNHNFGSIAVLSLGLTYHYPKKEALDITLERGALGDFTITNETVGTGDGSRTEFDTAFDFPTDAVISINGVQKTSGVSVIEKPSNKPCLWFIRPIYDESTPSLILSQANTSVGADAKSVWVLSIPVDTTPKILCNYENIPMIGAIPKTIGTNAKYKLEGSDDLSEWTLLHDFEDAASQFTATYRFYRIRRQSGSGLVSNLFDFTTGHNIVFSEPPAVGDIITVSYKTGVIPKDADHVFDMSVTLHFGDYVPE